MTEEHFVEHFRAHEKVIDASLRELEEPSNAAAEALIQCVRRGGKVLCFGNGGSATQASHLVGELLGRYKDTRRPLAALALGSDPGPVTCIANDFGYESVFARQLEALAAPGDVAIGLTTSGKSENVLRGLEAAKKRGATTIALCGGAGLARSGADHILCVPSNITAHIQEVHLMLLHVWCVAIDAALAAAPEGGNGSDQA
jgi:D-sedoheptulose 7-phosphate isomerase